MLSRLFTKFSTPLFNTKTFYFAVLISSLIYGLCISYMNPIVDNASAFLFIINLIILSVWAFRLPKNKMMFVFVPIFLHLGILLGGMHAVDPTKIFWGMDSVNFHIPHSINAFSEIHNLVNLQTNKNYGESFLLTHLITGIVFKIIGVSVFSTTISMLILKIPTVFLINSLGKRLFNSDVGFLSAFVFVFYPSVIVFDAIFFKEITIQLFLVSYFIFLYDFYTLKKSYLILPITLLLLMLTIERTYLLPSLFGALIVSTYFFLKEFSKIYKVIIWGSIIAIFLFFVNYFSSSYPPSQLIQKAQEVRELYKSLNSVNTKWNYDIPYVLAIVKVIFTPYFTFSKFESYFSLTSLIVWSAPINQLVILFSCFGMFRYLKKDKFLLPIVLAFAIYILLLAYFRPYDGRVRDSYIPVIIIFAVAAIRYFKENIFKENK